MKDGKGAVRQHPDQGERRCPWTFQLGRLRTPEAIPVFAAQRKMAIYSSGEGTGVRLFEIRVISAALERHQRGAWLCSPQAAQSADKRCRPRPTIVSVLSD